MTSIPSSPISPNGTVHSLSIDSSPSSPSQSSTSTPSKPLTSSPPHPRTSRWLIPTILILTTIASALLIGLLAGLLTRSSSSSSPSPPPPTPSTYRAVAVQYLPYSNLSSPPSTLLALNLAAYRSIVSSLTPLSPDLVAFPEGGLGYLQADESSPLNATATRAALLPYCEAVPPPHSPLHRPLPHPQRRLQPSTHRPLLPRSHRRHLPHRQPLPGRTLHPRLLPPLPLYPPLFPFRCLPLPQ